MTGSPDDAFEALRLPQQPVEPRRAFADDLRVRVHRRLGLPAPNEITIFTSDAARRRSASFIASASGAMPST